ncbi:MAG: hypothetical protein IJO43_01750 [Bacilli bacterium]|nr:hypothetical protein [Bacilli bacterium]
MNNKGLVRIKVLTIVFICGIICFTLIPYLYNYYGNYKKEKYIEIAKEYIAEVKDSVNSLKYHQLPSSNEGLLVKLKDLELNKKSPYGKFDDEYSYVVVINMGDYYDYYFAAIDSKNYGIPVVNEKELTTDSIVYGKSKLTSIKQANYIDDLYIDGTIFKQSENSKKNDNNILLVPVSGELTVSYDFIENVHKIYTTLIKNMDTDIYNKEATINNGVLKYDNKVINDNYSKDINGFSRYISFPNNDDKIYYNSFVNYSKSYVAGIINESNDYETSDIVFDSMPTTVINRNAKTVTDNEQKYLMFNLMAIYPDNDNYSITECGALILKSNSGEIINIDFNTQNIIVGKSNNSCELGNIFAIRKSNVKENEKYIARGYIKYKDQNGKEYTTLSRDIIAGTVKQ